MFTAGAELRVNENVTIQNQFDAFEVRLLKLTPFCEHVMGMDQSDTFKTHPFSERARASLVAASASRALLVELPTRFTKCSDTQVRRPIVSLALSLRSAICPRLWILVYVQVISREHFRKASALILIVRCHLCFSIHCVYVL